MPVNKLTLIEEQVQETFPLTPIQEGLLFNRIKQSEAGRQTNQIMVGLTGELNKDAFARAWDTVAQRNEMLRAMIRWEEEETPALRIMKSWKPPVKDHDLSGLPEAEQDRAVGCIRAADRNEADISRSLFVVSLCTLGRGQYRMIMTSHRLVSDEDGDGRILDEFFRVYESVAQGDEAALAAKPSYRQYDAFLRAQRTNRAKAYWKRVLAGYEPRDHFPVERKGAEGTELWARSSRPVPVSLQQALAGFTAKLGLDSSAVLYAAWAVLLRYYSDSADVMFGVRMPGRPQPFEEIVACATNTLPLRAVADDVETALDFVQDIALKVHDLSGHAFDPPADIKAGCPSPSGESIIDSVFRIEAPMGSYPAGGTLTVTGYEAEEWYEHPVNVTFRNGAEPEVKLTYDAAKFKASTMSRVLDHYLRILKDMIGRADKSLAEVNMLSHEERNTLITEFNRTDTAVDGEWTIPGRFARQAALTPERTAVMFRNTRLTYRELNERANRLARRLRRERIGPNTVVGIYMERSSDMMVAIMAVLKAGGAYLPLDPDYPEERIRFILEDSGARVLLVQSGSDGQIPFPGPTLAVDDAAAAAEDCADVPPLHTGEDVAYIIYTSGSTGKPKGVMIQHKAIMNTLCWNFDYYRYDGTEVVLIMDSFAFDNSVQDTFSPLLVGASIVILEQAKRLDAGYIGDVIESCQVTRLSTVPTLYAILLEHAYPKMGSLKLVILAGENLSLKLAANHFAALPNCRLFNEYGPTENSVNTTVYELTPECGEILIGQPISNTKCYVVGKDNRLMPIGLPGELCIAGRGLSQGYVNRAELTRAKFVDNPFEPGTSMYKTGDLARWNEEGNLEFLGRVDRQIKLKGYRIELDEIEQALLRYEAVKQAAVVDLASPDGLKYLCAYFTADGKVDAEHVKAFLALELPAYMIPAHLMQIERIPMLTSGKINRSALPAPDTRPAAGHGGSGLPPTAIERDLLVLWEETGGRPGTEAHEPVLSGDADSILLMRFYAKINKKYPNALSITDLFKHSGIQDIAKRIEAHFVR
ncbi:non-ribosomal peptide synthetase [Paenibacillus oleatilyticus]|uniref:non-ribosomal peptide synthetase n=1 Tax=Paenibacillus oleatilyticus TaxID=2594886 RepID=UPI001C1F9198|nr:amino acid adenylation domain-containing protein [Paenibacillus oleatilyticus]MBU7315054.1 amino acid adenylation domain-containing protein [Paenibacillus oleatilyticus]